MVSQRTQKRPRNHFASIVLAECVSLIATRWTNGHRDPMDLPAGCHCEQTLSRSNSVPGSTHGTGGAPTIEIRQAHSWLSLGPDTLHR